MSTLIDAGGAIPDRYSSVADADALASTDGAILVPMELLETALAGRRNESLGVLVPNRANVDDLARHFDALDLIAIAFPSFSDGTGFSLAHRLRRAGFRGRLRASGPLVADQFAEALACGFDEVELPDASAQRQPVEQWLSAKDSITAHYQTGYFEDRSILSQRLQARRAR